MSKDATLAMQSTFILTLQIYYTEVTLVTKTTSPPK